MTKIEINAAASALMTNHVAHYGDHSESNKAHFKGFYDLVKGKKSRKNAVVALGEASKKIQLESSKREFIAMVKMAVTFSEIQSVMNLTAITWENLKRGVKLYAKVVKNFKPEDKVECIKSLGEVWKTGMSPFLYNNTLEVTIKKLNELYTVEKVEEHEKVLERIMTDMDILTVDELTQLVKDIQAKLTLKGETVTETAETVEESTEVEEASTEELASA